MKMETTRRKQIGIVGFGLIGQFLYDAIKNSSDMEVGFVWNRSREKLQNLPAHELLENLDGFRKRTVDLIVEVAHVSITKEYGEKFLEHADYMIGSPTALANVDLEQKLKCAALHHALYVPSGAFWGAEDITKMADQGSLKALKVTMKKHPSSFKLLGELAQKIIQVGNDPVVLYDGPVRPLCPMAPANVNTMACASIAAHNLGFDQVQGCLIADKSLNCHIVEIEVTGPCFGKEEYFTVKTVRSNPSKMGAVTGNATYASFLQSLKRAHGKGAGIHLC